ncbi:MAG: right-handed parallel beta-helix repeat-containing protein [Nitrospinae bacterium]|nr:right-handed parallel beta-helix repeat-containing protein [Nitrospinota bacterium]MBI3813461.1 right-handed parallel beta-helix repeat-containing protein [Nitrospinota bacterium]
MKNICKLFGKTLIILTLLLFGSAEAAVISVPLQFKSIQEAVNAASSGDTVQVSAGVYKEQIKLKTGVTVKGEGYEKTTIDGSKKDGSVVVGASDAVIEGFTIRNSGIRGRQGDAMDAGIKIDSAAMAVLNNRIINNNAGILSFHGSTSLIANNIIEENENFGIYLIYSNPLIENNIVYRNKVRGIFCAYSKPEIVNNTIVANPTGIYTEVSSSVIKNNIITDSDAIGFQIAESPRDQKGVEPYLSYNVFYNNGHDLSNVEKGEGDITKDPLFADGAKRDFRLKPNSPAANAGDPDPKYNDPDRSRADAGAFGGSHAAGKEKSRNWTAFKKSKEGEAVAIEKNYMTARSLSEKGSKGYKEENTRVNYYSYCAPCHGQTGKGDGPLAESLEQGVVPRDHTSAEYFSQKTDDEIFEVIKHGGVKAGFSETMPPFDGQISDDAMRDLVKFIRELCNCQYKK